MISEKQFGLAIKELRKAAGISQRELAERSGIAKQAITNIERGATLPTLRTLEKLAITLGVPPSEVLRRAEGQTPAGPPGLSPADRELWNSLGPDTRQLITDFLRVVADWSSGRRRKGD